MQEKSKKKILIAIPTANDIEADTFKSIFDCVKHLSDEYEADFNAFYGYRVDQVRNLICNWVKKGYDYLFAVDHDITFHPHTLKWMLEDDKDMVSGIYRQRLPEPALEIYDNHLMRMPIEKINQNGLTQIGGCGMGCVLIKTEVLKTIDYPQFEYFPALDHNNTFSEDLDFCRKATTHGFEIYCDSRIICGHIGKTVYEVPPFPADPVLVRFEELRTSVSLPRDHVDNLWKLKEEGFEPKMIFDIGACVLHWYDVASQVWPDAEIIPMEAMPDIHKLYSKNNIVPFVSGVVFSYCDDMTVEFYQNTYHPGGNSIYKENPSLSPRAEELFPPENTIKLKTVTIDNLVRENNIPQPDLIKMDIQGSEYDALVGAEETIKNTKYLLLELQHQDYNLKAPKANQVIEYLQEKGFELVRTFGGNELSVDRDYLFKNVNV